MASKIYSNTQGQTAQLAERQGLQNLYQMLQSQGSIDPRILATLQAQSARSTQQQQDAARAAASRGGFSRGGLAQALQAGIGAAGAARSSGLALQNASDAYGRNQQNLGLLGQIVQQPNLGYANLNEQRDQFAKNMRQQQIAAGLSFAGSLVGGAAGGR